MGSLEMSRGIKDGIRPGLVEGIGSWWQRFPITAADMAALVGKTPDHIWMLDELSGDTIDRVGSADLSPTSGPTQGVATPFPKLGASFANVSFESFDAASSAVLDIDATTSVAFLFIAKLDVATSTRALFGKRTGAGDLNGFELNFLATPLARWTVDSGPSVLNIDVVGDHITGLWGAYLCYLDRNIDVAGIITPLGSATGDATPVGSLTSAQLFSIGEGRSRTPTMTVAYAAAFTGANAEGMGQQTYDNFWRGV